MTDDTAIDEDDSEAEPPRPVIPFRTFLWKSVRMGLLSFAAAMLALGGLIAAGSTFAPHIFETMLPGVDPLRSGDAMGPLWLVAFVFNALVFAPLVETLAFPLIHWMLSAFPGMRRLFTPVVAVIAYYFHGGALFNLVQAAAFAVFAIYYDGLKRSRTIPPAYWGAVFAHVTYNALVLAVAAALSVTFPA